ncbi:peptidoglycan DD-metalloendopeptidase family protein [Virgisporangium aurantiacum]|uniref:peptidoglycan DD-metalloendopeptidase family protein n=1 Tax=Virgisporangium aurantiacum TaxID=175570 RepID=UPI0019514418|nr:peptidoglycan DD-metalloendopeptidase family protein [Virgisporangium aurantiacum]
MAQNGGTASNVDNTDDDDDDGRGPVPLNPGFKLPAWDHNPANREQTRDPSVTPGPVPEYYMHNGQRIPYLATLLSAARRWGIPWYVLAAVSWQESKHGSHPDTWIPRPADGSVGPMQFTPPTWEQFSNMLSQKPNERGKRRIDRVEDQLTMAAFMLHTAANDLRSQKFTDSPEATMAALNRYNYRKPWQNDILFWAEKYAGGGAVNGGDVTGSSPVCGSDVDTGQLKTVVAFVRHQVTRLLPNGLHVPYIWGATGPDAFDCSGLMVQAYKSIGVNIPRTTAPQADSDMMEIVARQPLTGAEGLRPGDLLFIDNGYRLAQDLSTRFPGRYVGHVAMFLGLDKDGQPEVGEAHSSNVGLQITNFKTRWQTVIAVGRVKGITTGGGAAGTWARPTSGYAGSPFGMRDGVQHNGLDIETGCGTPIRAVADGTVILSSGDVSVVGGYGQYILIDHGGGLHTGYGHEQQRYVSEGQRVSKGQHIADVGTEGRSSGCHLHFDVRQAAANGTPWTGKPVDPMPVLREHGVPY